MNPSLYLMRAEVFYQGVGMIRNDNAQAEYYLTDIVRLLSGVRDAKGRAPLSRPRRADRSSRVGAKLQFARRAAGDSGLRAPEAACTAPTAPEAVNRPQLKPTQYATVRQWLAKIEAGRPGHAPLARSDLRPPRRPAPAEMQGPARRAGMLRKTLRHGREGVHRAGAGPGQPHGPPRRSPRRNDQLPGHRPRDGGRGRPARATTKCVAVNTQPGKYKPVHFNISELMGRMGWSDWLDFVNSDWVRNIVYLSAGHWGNYIKAAMLRLQHRYQDVRVRGVNMAVAGNIPIAAGLSSSSTIVVATLQSAIALNNFDLTSQQFIDLCGEGEWFVGSRGGAGDHAAIYLGQRAKIAQVGYLPFRVEKIIDAPADYQVVIANSHVKAAKSASARDEFNSRIASYNLGLALLKQRCPEIAGTVEHLRDIDPDKLGYPTSDVYRWLLRVPETMTRNDFRVMLSQEHQRLLESNFATHAEPAAYHPRGVLLYGIAEIIRSRMCVDLLEAGRVEEFGAPDEDQPRRRPRQPAGAGRQLSSHWPAIAATNISSG